MHPAEFGGLLLSNLGDQPLVIFMDELPPYLECVRAVPVSNGNLATVTTAALANLFVVVTEMPSVCLVLSDLGGTNYAASQDSINQAVSNAIQQVTGESMRIVVPITRSIQMPTSAIPSFANAF